MAGRAGDWPVGATAPWLDEVQMAGGAPAGRFETLPEFRVETVVEPEETGSLLTLTFNEFGEILASREGTGIMLIRDCQHDGKFDKTEFFSDKVMNVQGLLALNGQVFAVGKGPDGLGLYRLTDEDGDHHADKCRNAAEIHRRCRRTRSARRHAGSRRIVVRDDGQSHASRQAVEANSPFHHFYEGDLITPKYEDPHGHAVGIKAPCGTIVRTDVNGSFVELFAGGFRNCYDLAFNRAGELFTSDSDMEWDEGLPWYRPTRALHVTPGGEFGSRSGWSVWPDYYFDSLPATDRHGSRLADGHGGLQPRDVPATLPRCAVHGRLVARTNSGHLFEAARWYLHDRSGNLCGRQTAERHRIGCRSRWRPVFLHRRPRNRRGRLPHRLARPSARGSDRFGRRHPAALRQPQFNSAFARQKIAQSNSNWAPLGMQLPAIAESPTATSGRSLPALDFMHLFGPFPNADAMVRLAGDHDAPLSRQSGLSDGNASRLDTHRKLVQLLRDRDPAGRNALLANRWSATG